MKEEIYIFLSRHPMVGSIASIGGIIPSLIENISVYLQFISLLLGVLIGIFTLLIQIKKFRNGNNK